MKKNKIIIFFLILVGITLFFFTYHFGNKKDKIAGIEKDILTEDVDKLAVGISNLIENVNYTGTNNKGTFFQINAETAEVFNDKPDISNMNIVNAIISAREGKRIYIKSDYATYDRLTNDAKFLGNVLVTESSNEIECDNLNLFLSKNLITAYNNVKYNGVKGSLIADKIDMNILENEVNIFMFEKNDTVQVKYKN